MSRNNRYAVDLALAQYGVRPKWAAIDQPGDAARTAEKARRRRARRQARKQRRNKADNYRKHISKAKRLRIYERDGYCCVECGLDLSERPHLRTLDHIIPVLRGGTNAAANLQMMCRRCNCAKGATLPERSTAA